MINHLEAAGRPGCNFLEVKRRASIAFYKKYAELISTGFAIHVHKTLTTLVYANFS